MGNFSLNTYVEFLGKILNFFQKILKKDAPRIGGASCVLSICLEISNFASEKLKFTLVAELEHFGFAEY
jgi:hypothetical protein